MLLYQSLAPQIAKLFRAAHIVPFPQDAADDSDHPKDDVSTERQMVKARRFPQQMPPNVRRHENDKPEERQNAVHIVDPPKVETSCSREPREHIYHLCLHELKANIRRLLLTSGKL